MVSVIYLSGISVLLRRKAFRQKIRLNDSEGGWN